MGKGALWKVSSLHVTANELHNLLTCFPAGNPCLQLVEGLHGIASKWGVPPGR